MTQEEFENLMNEMHDSAQSQTIYVEYITQVLLSLQIGMFEVNVN